MASLRLRAPSPGLLRFLRSQSDQLGFSLEPPSASASVAKISCAASRARRNTKGCLSTLKNSDAPSPRATNLQAGLLNLDGLLRPRATRQPKTPHSTKAPEFFTAAVGARWRSTGSHNDSCTPTWRERIFGQPVRRESQPLEPDDLPGGPSDAEHNSMFNGRRQLRQKAALEPRLRCTEVDEHGNAVLVDGEFKKSELIARVRDILVLAGAAVHKPSMILTYGVVWPPATRFAQDRFLEPPTYPCPPVSYSPQSPPSQSAHQV